MLVCFSVLPFHFSAAKVYILRVLEKLYAHFFSIMVLLRNYLEQMKSRFTDIKQTKCAIFVNLTPNAKKQL